MNEFVSWCMHLLVPFIFHEVTSLHPPSFLREISSQHRAFTDALIAILCVCQTGCHFLPSNKSVVSAPPPTKTRTLKSTPTPNTTPECADGGAMGVGRVTCLETEATTLPTL